MQIPLVKSSTNISNFSLSNQEVKISCTGCGSAEFEIVNLTAVGNGIEVG
jgi:hypothetical protein